MFKRGNVPEPKDYIWCARAAGNCAGRVRLGRQTIGQSGVDVIKSKILYEGDEKTEGKDYLAVRALMHPKAGLEGLARTTNLLLRE